jgi:hypothetical protein
MHRSPNRELYSLCPGVADIISICLHPRAEDRASRVSSIMQAIDLFSPSEIDHLERTDTLSQVEKELSDLLRSIESLRAVPTPANHPIFQRLVLYRARQLRDEIAHLSSNLFVLEGDRETHLNGILTCLDSLGEDDEVLAVTSSHFWKPGNFGPYGRLLTKITSLIDRKARVSWIVLTRKEPLGVDAEVMSYISQAISDYCTIRGNDKLADVVGKEKKLYVGFCPRTEVQIDSFRKARDAFILLKHQDEWLLVAPDYRIGDYGSKGQAIAVETTVTSIRIWGQARRTDELRLKHQELLSESKSIQEWDRTGTSAPSVGSVKRPRGGSGGFKA